MSYFQSINCRGRLLSLETPKVMGIINVNQDSFYASSRVLEMDSIMSKVQQMLDEGAAIIDIGAMSSKPGSSISVADDEIKVLVPIVKHLIRNFPDIIISIDTLHSLVAKETIFHGASIINDISGGTFDPEMLSSIAHKNVPFIMMHMQGLPTNMHINPHYDEVVLDIMKYFSKQLHLAAGFGIADIIIDPGFGFGKKLTHNFELIKSFEVFQIYGLPLLAGISRKSMIWRTLGISSDEALNGTTALHMVLLQKGAKILRVHDVKEAVQCINLYQQLV